MGSGQQCRGTKEASAVRQIQSGHEAVTTVHILTKAKPTRPPLELAGCIQANVPPPPQIHRTPNKASPGKKKAESKVGPGTVNPTQGS